MTISDPAARPALAHGVELVGEFRDGAFVDAQWLIRDRGRFLQVTELLFRIAEQLDGRRTHGEIADAVTERVPWRLTAEQVRQLIDTKLVPLGVVDPDGDGDGAPLPRDRAPSPLELAGKVRLVGPRVLDPVTRVLAGLFRPLLVVLGLLAAAAAHVWLYLDHGLTAGIVELLYTPALILPLILVIFASGVVHEFGHAAALRYGGGRAASMGFGFYLIYPALYTDTSDAYRLGRWARVRVDLGGFYFHLLCALALMAVSVATGHEWLLVAVLAINLELLRQLLFPFVRFDGYWLLADLTGVPDLFAQVGPFLRGLLPASRRSGALLPPLKPWARRVFATYVALVAVVLPGLIYVFATRAPAFIARGWDSLGLQASAVEAAFAGRDALALVTAVVQVVILVLPFVAAVLMVAILGRLFVRFALALRRAIVQARAVAGPVAV
jgi:putative peptide zinc metalloprotease protein